MSRLRHGLPLGMFLVLSACSGGRDSLLPQVTATTLPDLPAFAPAVGYPCTGLAVGTDQTLWGGVGTAGKSDSAGIVQFNRAGSVRNYITLRDLGLPAGSVQGVATDPAGNVWFVWKKRPNSKIVAVDGRGRLLKVADFKRERANGLAFDSKRNQLIILYDDGTVEWVDPVSFQRGETRLSVDQKGADHLFYDAFQDALYLSWGRNGEDGKITKFDIATKSETNTWALEGADAIEGIAIVNGNELLVTNDAATHPGQPKLNRILSYRLPPEQGI